MLVLSIRHCVGGVAAVLLMGCSNMTLDKVASDTPVFDFVSFFEGHTRASGWFADRFGNVKRHFCGDFMGKQDGDRFLLDEKLFYNDGVTEERVWSVEVGDNGEFRAESDSLVGPAVGRLKGNGLNIKCTMRVLVDGGKEWKLKMDDFMLYQSDGSLHNITHVNKWGLRIGTVSTQYVRHDGQQMCPGN